MRRREASRRPDGTDVGGDVVRNGKAAGDGTEHALLDKTEQGTAPSPQAAASLLDQAADYSEEYGDLHSGAVEFDEKTPGEFWSIYVDDVVQVVRPQHGPQRPRTSASPRG